MLTSVGDATTAQNDLEAQKAIFRRHIEEVMNQKNFDLVYELFDPEWEGVVPAKADPVQGPDGFLAMGTGWRRAFPDLKLTVEEIISEGDMVAAIVDCKGTQQDEIMGFPATGREAHFKAIHFFKLRDGRMFRDTIVYDRLDVLQQLGHFEPQLGKSETG